MIDSDTRQIYQNWPVKLLQEFDQVWKGRYRNRTEATLDAVRKLIAQLKEA